MSNIDDIKSIATRFLAVLAEDEQGIAAWHVAVGNLGRQLHNALTDTFVAEGRTDPNWPLPDGLRWSTDEDGKICIVGRPELATPSLRIGKVRPGFTFSAYGKLLDREDSRELLQILRRRADAETSAV